MLKKRNYIILAAAFIVLFSVYFADLGFAPENRAAQVVLAITAFAGILWVSEALPLHVSGILIAFILATVGSFKAGDVFSPFFDPIIVLLLGGFVLAVGMQKHGLDKFMALKFLNRIGENPKYVLLGIMSVTSFLSFWVTNTAATLIMLPIGLSILKSNGLKPPKSSYSKALVLGVAFSATIGGIATIIGSTPNAISVKFLADQGITVTFLDWMFFGLPLVLITLPIIWVTLLIFFRPEIKKITVQKFTEKITKNQKMVLSIFIITVILWLTAYLHGIPDSVVALVPVILLYLLGLLNVGDFSKVSWTALILFGSGLSLGSAIHASGLDSIVANYMSYALVNQPLIIVLLAVAVVGIAFTAVASNTAAASIFIPIMIPFAVMFGIDLRLLTIFAAISVSLDFILPIGTPPDTIAYSSGYVRTRDMAKAGIVISILSLLILTGLFFLW